MMSRDIMWHHWHNRGVGCVIQGGLSWKVTSLKYWTNTSVLLSPSLTFQLKVKVYVFLPIFQSIWSLEKWLQCTKYINIWKPSYLANDGVRRHDVTRSWPVPSLIFKFDRLITYEVGKTGLDVCCRPGPVTAPRHSLTATLTLSTPN